MITEETITVDGTSVVVRYEENGLVTALDRCPYCQSDLVSSIDRDAFQCEDCGEVIHPLRDREAQD